MSTAWASKGSRDTVPTRAHTVKRMYVCMYVCSQKTYSIDMQIRSIHRSIHILHSSYCTRHDRSIPHCVDGCRFRPLVHTLGREYGKFLEGRCARNSPVLSMPVFPPSNRRAAQHNTCIHRIYCTFRGRCNCSDTLHVRAILLREERRRREKGARRSRSFLHELARLLVAVLGCPSSVGGRSFEKRGELSRKYESGVVFADVYAFFLRA